MGLFKGAATGLVTSPNPFNAAPDGSLARADNVVFSAPSVLEPRRGMTELVDATFGTSDSRGDSLAYYGTNLLLAYDLTKVAIRPNSGTFTDFTATYEPPSTNRMRFVPAVRSVFFNTLNGIYDYDGTGQPYLAGCPQPLSIQATNSTVQGWQTPDTAVAYRFTVCRYDNFGRVVEGPPSGRTILQNSIVSVYPTDGVTRSGGTTVHVTTEFPHLLQVGEVVNLQPGETNFPPGDKTITAVASNGVQFDYAEAGANVSATVTQFWDITRSADLTLVLPVATQGQPVTTANFLRVYRSDETFAATAEFPVIDTPGDNLAQCYETPALTALDIARGYVQFNDICPENFLGAPLYTNPNTGDGIGTAKYPPPKARDFVYFANRAWYANTADKHSMSLSLIGTGAPSGIQDNDGIVIKPATGSDITLIGTTTNPILTTPINDTFTDAAVGGSLPAATYYYRVSALDSSGDETLASTETSIMVVTGGTTHTVTVNWIAVTGAVGYKVYGRTTGTELLIAAVGAVTTYIDTGAITPAGALPIKNSTGNQFFQIFTDGDPGFNIQRTAQALVAAINANTFNPEVYAFYTSGDGPRDVPGQMLLVAREFGDTHSFSVYFGGAHGTAWSPQLPNIISPAFTAPASDDNRHPAGLWHSTLGVPDAVPPLNYIPIDQDNDEILRIFPLHYRLLIFKSNGIYFCGNGSDVSVTKLSDYRLLAPDSVALLDDKVYALTDQGVVVITDSGVQPISIAIDDTLTRLGNPDALTNLREKTIGLSYRSSRQYLCWMIESVLDEGGLPSFTTHNTQAFVYSTLSGGFTRYTYGVTAAAIDPNSDHMVATPTDANYVLAENKTLTIADYTDLRFTTAASAISGDTITLDDVSFIVAGDVIARQGFEDDRFIILSVDADASTVTMLGEPDWNPDTGIVIFQGISTALTFNKLTAGDPALVKMVEQVCYLFRRNTTYNTVANFSTEVTIIPQSVDLLNDTWGEFPWGELAWGNPTQQIRRVQPLPMEIGDACQLTVGFTTRQAFSVFDFLGIDAVSRADTDAGGE